VGVPEGHPGPDQELGQVGGTRRRIVGGRRHAIGDEGELGQHPREGGQTEADLVQGIEQRLFVLLEVPVVRQGQALQGGQQPRQVADETTGLPPGQLGHVGVLLLGHHRTAGGVGVREAAEAELLRAPQHQLLPDAREVHPEQGQGEEGLGHEVPVPDGVEGVVEGPGEAQVGGHARGVQGQRRARQGPGAQRRDVEAAPAVQQPVHVAGQGPAVGQQVVGQQDGLGPLQVRVARKIGLAHLVGPLGQDALEGEDAVHDHPQLPLGEQAQVSGHLVVATPTGVELGPRRTGDLGHPALDRGVDVLVRRLEGEAADMSPRAGEVVARQPHVEGQADRVRQQLLGRPVPEPPVPEGQGSSAFCSRRLAAQVSRPRPHRRTKPALSSWLKLSSAS